MKTNTPNLFSWATSELSQDAFFLWLFEWARPELESIDSGLHETATWLIKKLCGSCISEIKTIELLKQHKNIDIVIKINDEFAILIEDKVHAREYAGQLEGYKATLLNEFDSEKLFCVYLKTGDQSQLKHIEDLGYTTFVRKDVLQLLNYGKEQGVTNNIFNDYLTHVTNINDSVESYKNLPLDKWDWWYSWIGFYSELQNRLGEGEWQHVPQKNGGFLGFWWFDNEKKFEGTTFKYYLQLEYNKFCFKIYPRDGEKGYQIRDYYRALLYPKAIDHGISIYQNGKFGNSMTVAALSDDIRQVNSSGLIDMDKTIEYIRKIEKMVSEL